MTIQPIVEGDGEILIFTGAQRARVCVVRRLEAVPGKQLPRARELLLNFRLPLPGLSDGHVRRAEQCGACPDGDCGPNHEASLSAR